MLGLYIHVPYCRQRCVYCDFYFVTGKRDRSGFIRALDQEIRRCTLHAPVGTIYLGGGTPSRLAPSDIGHILATLHDTFDTSHVAEITIEINPDDTYAPYLRALNELGITRVSLGIQSFFDDELRFMNRSHDADEATRALALVAEAGFASYTVDLIFGLPGQSVGRWTKNLDRLKDFDPPHVSTYSLTVEPRTPLHKQVARGIVTPAADDLVAAQYQVAMDTLRGRGYEHYEISSFALPGHRSRHNGQYWTHANYLGLGPSAHSFWWDPPSPARRWHNVRSLRKYLIRAGSGASLVERQESLTLSTLAAERIMLGLRTMEGIDLQLLSERYGTDLLTIRRSHINTLLAGGLILYQSPFLRLTDQGKHVCDSVTTRLIP